MVSVLAGLAGGAASNVMSEWHADNQMKREEKLMNKQNVLNRANALDAYSQQVQGLRMAGLSPAMLNGQTPNVAAPVSKGSVGMAENVEFDPATLLLDAQRENVEADTEKKEAETDKIKGVDTKNVEADTNLKVVQSLLGETNKDKVEAEAKSIKNINDQFELEKGGTALFGQAIAQDWQKQPWYNKLTSGQKMIVDDIAKGEVDLYPGTMTALVKSIKANGDMSEMQRNQLADAMSQVLTDAQMKDKKVMDALAKMPDVQRNKAKAEINESYKRAANLDLENKWNTDKYGVYKGQDVDYLYNEYLKDPDNNEKMLRWLHATTNEKFNKLFDAAKNIAPAYVGGKAVGSGVKQGSEMNHRVNGKINPEHSKQKSPFYKYGLGDWVENQGVQNMKKK